MKRLPHKNNNRTTIKEVVVITVANNKTLSSNFVQISHRTKNIITKSENIMPNWCYTSLNVNGSKEQIAELSSLVSDAIENDNSLCNAIIPRPEAESENWYEWNCRNWGSKWDVTNLFVKYEDDTQLNLSFATAWNPITPIFDELVKRGFKVLAEYQDEGYMFAGQYEDGKETDFKILVCEDCQELDEPNKECKCEGNGVIVVR